MCDQWYQALPGNEPGVDRGDYSDADYDLYSSDHGDLVTLWTGNIVTSVGRWGLGKLWVGTILYKRQYDIGGAYASTEVVE